MEWIAPVSFLEAQKLPKPMLNFFLQMDDLLNRMLEQKRAKNHGR